MAKAIRIGRSVAYHCPACKMPHGVPVEGGTAWGFNGKLDKPTLTPSVKHTMTCYGRSDKVCHYFIRDGRIEYCGDCTHAMSGQTVDLPDARATEDGKGIVWNPEDDA